MNVIKQAVEALNTRCRDKIYTEKEIKAVHDNLLAERDYKIRLIDLSKNLKLSTKTVTEIKQELLKLGIKERFALRTGGHKYQEKGFTYVTKKQLRTFKPVSAFAGLI